MKQMELLQPANGLYVVIAIVMMVVIGFGYKKKNRIMQAFGLGYELGVQRMKIAFMALGLLLMVVALMAPAREDGVTEVKSEGLDIYVLIDTSKSMLAEDVAPSRIKVAQGMLLRLLNQMDGDRVGFIPFSSSAYVQMPLTDDYDLASMFLNVMDTDMISGGGSDVGNAIEVAMDAFDQSPQGDQVILILSDGEEHTPKASEIIRTMRNDKIKVFSIGVGTLDGGLIPEYDQEGQVKQGYKKDSSSRTIMSKLNESLLVELAQTTGGHYYNAEATNGDVNGLINDINGLKRGNQTSRKMVHYQHLYQYFLGIGIGLLLMGLLIPERSRAYE